MLRRFAPQCSAMISAAKSRVISRLRRGYIRPSGGLCFAAAGGKANVCRTWRHIFIDGAHGWKSVRGAGAPLPCTALPKRKPQLSPPRAGCPHPALCGAVPHSATFPQGEGEAAAAAHHRFTSVRYSSFLIPNS